MVYANKQNTAVRCTSLGLNKGIHEISGAKCYDPFMITITRKADTFELAGIIDESLDFSQLYQYGDLIRLDLDAVTGINSIGTAKLIQLFQRRAGFQIEYYRCPSFFIQASNNIPMLLGPKRDPQAVKSLYYPYDCTLCVCEHSVLLNTKPLLGGGKNLSMPVLACPTCGVIMRLLEDPEDYLGFIFANFDKRAS